MIFKHKETGELLELDNPATHSLAERNGFEPIEEHDEELAALREKAKELGIKSAHTMKKETLITKITEIQ
jgi:hypothetical protein